MNKLATSSLLREQENKESKKFLMELEVIGFLVLTEVAISYDKEGLATSAAYDIISVDGNGEAVLPSMDTLNEAISQRMQMAILRYLNRNLTCETANAN